MSHDWLTARGHGVACLFDSKGVYVTENVTQDGAMLRVWLMASVSDVACLADSKCE